jgi:hypothetical protein
MEVKDITGKELLVGYPVAFSDSGRQGAVHTGLISLIAKGAYNITWVYIVDDRTNRTNKRFPADVLLLPLNMVRVGVNS